MHITLIKFISNFLTTCPSIKITGTCVIYYIKIVPTCVWAADKLLADLKNQEELQQKYVALLSSTKGVKAADLTTGRVVKRRAITPLTVSFI